MDGLEADVSACSIDGDCQFALRASADVEDAGQGILKVLTASAGEVRVSHAGRAEGGPIAL